MSAFDKRTAAGLALAVASCLALAGIGKTGKVAGPNDPGVAVAPPDRGIQLRCWQEGRLLFETRALDAMPRIQPTTVAVSGRTGDGQLQVINLHGGLCLLMPSAASQGPAVTDAPAPQ